MSDSDLSVAVEAAAASLESAAVMLKTAQRLVRTDEPSAFARHLGLIAEGASSLAWYVRDFEFIDTDVPD